MKKIITIIIAIVVYFISICIKASAQSPYAVFGDNSKILEAKKEPAPDIYSYEFYVSFISYSRK